MSVSKITDAAGIGTSTFYNFWKSKEEYLADLIFYHRQKMLPVLIPEDVKELAEKRFEAKKAKDWATADSLRLAISQMGYTIKDSKDGYTIEKA